MVVRSTRAGLSSASPSHVPWLCRCCRCRLLSFGHGANLMKGASWLSLRPLSVRVLHRHAHLFCDARGEPPHLGAVLLLGEECYWTHLAPSHEVLRCFQRRSDNQIMALELLSISLGMSTIEHLIANKCTIIHSDNTGSEVDVL